MPDCEAFSGVRMHTFKRQKELWPRKQSGATLQIPFNRPSLVGNELDYIREAVSQGQLAGDGAFTELCQSWIANRVGAKAVLLTHSCTAALEMAAILIGIGPGDEVIMPSFTFVSTANAVVLRQGVPVFVDIRPDTLNIDEGLIERAITPRTKAIFPVHYAGVPANLDAITEIAARHGLAVVEDAAQALGSTYKGRNAGSLGDLAAFSFHETKNIISGEGGALAINNPELIERAEIIREKGTNRKRFFRGQVDKYTWVDIGSSFLPGELIASYLYGQLEHAASIQAHRMAMWNSYDQALRSFKSRGLQTPFVPLGCEHIGHLYYIILPSLDLRQELIGRMRADGITTPFHYVPLHSAPAGRRYARVSGDLPHTERLSSRLVRLPLFPGMGAALHRVIDRLQTHLDSLLPVDSEASMTSCRSNHGDTV
jgi:dTDP-4-amino-4,6-dideoxygalactose transaminase